MSDMTRAEVGQLLNLDYFIRACIRPGEVMPESEKLRIPLSRIYAAEKFESVLWLVLGAQLDFFSRQGALAYYESLQDSLLPTVRDNRAHLESLFPAEGSLVNLLAAPNSFPKLRELMTKVVPSTATQISLLRSSLLLGSDIGADRSLRVFTASIHFASEPEWKEDILAPLIDPDETLKFLSTDKPESYLSSPEAVCAGFLRAIDYMSRFDSIFREVGTELNDQGVPDLRQSVRTILSWRTGSSVQRQRFLDLAEKIGKEFDSALATTAQAPRADSFRSGVTILMKYWNGEDQLLTAGAR